MIFNLAAGIPTFPVISFTVNGTEYFAQGANVDIENVWKVKYESARTLIWLRCSGTLSPILIRQATSDVFLCGPGSSGSSATEYSPGSGYEYIVGGTGGSGGECKTSSLTICSGVQMSAEIGSRETVLLSGDSFSVTARKGRGASGGNGAMSQRDPTTYDEAEEGGDGEYAFSDKTIDGVRYGAGGGGGGAAVYGSTTHYGADGGKTGGGRGRFSSSHDKAPAANQGGGGGGGGDDRGTDYPPDSGATGIIILSIPRIATS